MDTLFLPQLLWVQIMNSLFLKTYLIELILELLG